MRYFEGQKVLIRKDLKRGVRYAMANGGRTDVVTPEMLRWKGRIATIKRATKDGYLLKEDHDVWTWTDDMFDMSNECTIMRLKEIKERKSRFSRIFQMLELEGD